jgi:alpha-glucosidase
MWDQEGVHEIYREWRAVLDEYEGGRILVAEAWVQPAERLARYVRPDEMHQAFNFMYLSAPWRPADLRAVIDASLAANDEVGAPTTWVLSNHDVIRHATRLGYPIEQTRLHGIGPDDPQPDVGLGLRRARAATLQMLALPGSAYLYQGEELGLPEHTTMPHEHRQDPARLRSWHTVVGRDGCRVPIPWEADAPSYGFGPSDRSWLPQPAVWAEYALDRQQGVPGSTWELYRAALAARREYRLGTGTIAWLTPRAPGFSAPSVGPGAGIDGVPDEVLAFRNGDVLVLTNFGAEPVALPAAATVLLASEPLEADGRVPTDVTVWATF